MDLSCVCCIDLRTDNNGIWVHGGKPRRKHVVEIDSDIDEVINAVPEKESANMGETFTLVWYYHHHKTTPMFHKRIFYLIDSNNQCCNLVHL